MKPEQYLERQERFGVVGGIIGAILFVALGTWVSITAPELNVVIAVLDTLFIGVVGFLVGTLLGGVLSIPPEEIVKRSKCH